MNQYAEIQDNACVMGTFESILIDSKCPKTIKDNIIKLLDNRKDTKDPNIISINLTDIKDIKDIVKEFFEIEILTEIQSSTEFYKIEEIDNIISFGVLFLQGKNNPTDDNEYNVDNKHATRFINKVDNSVLLMDPKQGRLIRFPFNVIDDCSPNWFVFVKITKKDII